MAGLSKDVRDARAAIRSMLSEATPPTQREIAQATGISQSYVSKIVRCRFERLNDSIRKVSAYSKMDLGARVAARTSRAGIVARLHAETERVTASDPVLGEALADFLEKLGRRSPR